MVDGWRPLEVETLGDWLLRASGGFTPRGNSALALGSPGRPLDDTGAAVESWYVSRGLTPPVQLPLDASAGGIAEQLAGRGWRPGVGGHVGTAGAAPGPP